MFSKTYKALDYQRWFRQTCETNHWQVMRVNPHLYPEKQPVLDRVFGKAV